MNRDGSLSSIQRALQLLADLGGEGAGVSALARKTGSSKSTVHRLLSELRAAGWVEQDPESKTYHLGFQARLVGDLARRRHRLPELAEPAMTRLAKRTGQTVILSIREGFDALCVARIESEAPIRAVASDVGSIRPLGWGAGSTALLVDLSTEQLDEVVEFNRKRYPAVPIFLPEHMRERLSEVRRCGYAAHEGNISRGVGGVGMCVRGGGGEIECAISVAYVTGILDEPGWAELLKSLQEEVARLERRLAG